MRKLANLVHSEYEISLGPDEINLWLPSQSVRAHPQKGLRRASNLLKTAPIENTRLVEIYPGNIAECFQVAKSLPKLRLFLSH